ncbi:MAG: HIT domain-containing protein [Bacilli bacterium]|nr:HIT domain-containing protein [Bacilli bacterium]
MDCIFCKIIEGSIPSKTIYEDEIVKVFMDINPNSMGHLLIIPKKHIKDLTEMDDETFGHMNSVIKKMYTLLKEKLNFDGLRVLQNNGIIQEVKHYHIHMVPYYKHISEEKSVDEIFEIITK